MNSVSIQVSGVLKAVDKFKRLLRRRQARQRERIQQRERRKWQREQVNRRLHNGVGSLGSGTRSTSIREDAGLPVSGVDGAPRDLSTPKHHDTHGIDDGLHQAPGVASVGSSPTCTTVPADDRIPEDTSLASAVDEALSPRYVSSPHAEQACRVRHTFLPCRLSVQTARSVGEWRLVQTQAAGFQAQPRPGSSSTAHEPREGHHQEHTQHAARSHTANEAPGAGATRAGETSQGTTAGQSRDALT